MAAALLLAFIIGSGTADAGGHHGGIPVRTAVAQAALRDAYLQRAGMQSGVCWDTMRKAELSRFDADYHRFARLLESRYRLSARPDYILLDDRRPCNEYDNYAAYRLRYLRSLIRARLALGLEN